MSASRLLLINPGWEQDDLLARAQESGYELYALSMYGEAARGDDRFKAWEPLAGRDFETAIRWAREWDVEYVVSTQCDYGLQLQAFIAETMGLPGPGMAQAQRSANKWLQRQACENRPDILQPPYVLCFDVDSALRAYRAVGPEVVVKPVDNRGSIGVSIVCGEDELPAAVELAIAHSLSAMFLVERCLHGCLYLVDGIGEQVTIGGAKTMDANRPYMNEDIILRAVDADENLTRVAAAHRRTCQHLGYHRGLTSGEYIVNTEGIWLVEATNRAGGVWIGSKAVGVLTGRDASTILLDDFAAGGVGRSPSTRGDVVYLRYICLEPGYVTDIRGDASWPRIPGYLAHHLFQAVPGAVVPATDALKRSGVLLTVGDRQDHAIAVANRLLESLSVQYD